MTPCPDLALQVGPWGWGSTKLYAQPCHLRSPLIAPFLFKETWVSYSCVKSTRQFTEPLAATLQKEEGGHTAGTKLPIGITAEERPISAPTSHPAGVIGMFRDE